MDPVREFVWLGESDAIFERGHLYKTVYPAPVEKWISEGKAAWREDVPPEQVTVDLKPHPGTTRSASAGAKIA